MKIAKSRIKFVPKKIHVKKGDTVYILSGKDKNKIGKIVEVIPKLGKVTVENVNLKTKHLKPSQTNPEGGIFKIPSPIFSSKVMLYSNENKARIKITKKILEDGSKVRYSKKYDEII